MSQQPSGYVPNCLIILFWSPAIKESCEAGFCMFQSMIWSLLHVTLLFKMMWLCFELICPIVVFFVYPVCFWFPAMYYIYRGRSKNLRKKGSIPHPNLFPSLPLSFFLCPPADWPPLSFFPLSFSTVVPYYPVYFRPFLSWIGPWRSAVSPPP